MLSLVCDFGSADDRELAAHILRYLNLWYRFTGAHLDNWMRSAEAEWAVIFLDAAAAAENERVTYYQMQECVRESRKRLPHLPPAPPLQPCLFFEPVIITDSLTDTELAGYLVRNLYRSYREDGGGGEMLMEIELARLCDALLNLPSDLPAIDRLILIRSAKNRYNARAGDT